MADTEEMLRLIRHAADRLAEENPVPMFSEQIGKTISYADRTQAVEALMSLRLAMGYAESILRMVAACMGTEEPSVAPAGTSQAPPGAFDPAALYAELDRLREARGMSWRTIAKQAGVSASGLTKLSHGGQPSADVLVRLLGWLGTSDLDPFIRTDAADDS